MAKRTAKAEGYSDVLYLDGVHNKYIERGLCFQHFHGQGKFEGFAIATPGLKGTILPDGITRKSIMELASSHGFQVEERDVEVDELLKADEVFCTGTAVVLTPVGCLTYLGERICYGENGIGRISQQLYSALTSMRADDEFNWTVELK